MNPDSLKARLGWDRAVVIAGLSGIAAISWAYMLHLGLRMEKSMGTAGGMTRMQGWGTVDLLLTFLMWAVMMVAMMTPSSTPMILTFSRIRRQRRPEHNPLAETGAFLGGYLAVWTVFSAGATLAQWWLHRAALLSPMMVGNSPLFGGMLLIGAGAFQFTPLKNACLSRCRFPIGFFLTEWREGVGGAFRMGARHGVYCVGCCWLLMALLFVAGVMNLLWVAAIAAYVLVEKVVPAGDRVGWAVGLCLVALGVWMVSKTFL